MIPSILIDRRTNREYIQISSFQINRYRGAGIKFESLTGIKFEKYQARKGSSLTSIKFERYQV